MSVLPYLVAAFLSLSPFAAPRAMATQADLFSGLMNWAVRLSKYPAPSAMPVVRYVPQQFFDEHACGGHHCEVWGWYPNTGKNVVYVDENVRDLLNDGSNARSVLAASIIVHEFVHYLQAVSRHFARYDCMQALQLEREAYQAQSAYLMSYGRYLPVGVSMHSASCVGTASDGPIK
ncbi:MAG TPA: hypothetical protein VJ891_06670 [Casimicrobiaceae bacterium]|nr:hypothetical protein [Casimicrobiaceae bacterium]